MTTAMPSKSGEFRRVLWTGLYSQVVLMTVPVGGDIGDEVGLSLVIYLVEGKLYLKSYGVGKGIGSDRAFQDDGHTLEGLIEAGLVISHRYTPSTKL